MKIWLKVPYYLEITRKFEGTEFAEPPVLSIKSKKINSTVNTSLDFESGKVEAVSQIEISTQLFEELSRQCKKNPDQGLPCLDFIPQVRDEFYNILNEFDFAIKKVISIMRSRFHIIGISDNIVDRDEKISWSLDNVNFQTIYCIKSSIVVLGQTISKKDLHLIQNDLNNDNSPFFMAFRFLNSALNDDVPEFKILDATTAAELAIKEFLIRKNPALEKLLSELQSPPLPKLYGSILEQYSSVPGKNGEKSPRLKVLDYGNQLRNKIIHSPTKLEIPEFFAYFYCINVESAICHLLTLLYPDDPLWKKRFIQSYSVSTDEQKRLEKECRQFLEKI
jgi:hypothetical protein